VADARTAHLLTRALGSTDPWASVEELAQDPPPELLAVAQAHYAAADASSQQRRLLAWLLEQIRDEGADRALLSLLGGAGGTGRGRAAARRRWAWHGRPRRRTGAPAGRRRRLRGGHRHRRPFGLRIGVDAGAAAAPASGHPESAGPGRDRVGADEGNVLHRRPGGPAAAVAGAGARGVHGGPGTDGRPCRPPRPLQTASTDRPAVVDQLPPHNSGVRDDPVVADQHDVQPAAGVRPVRFVEPAGRADSGSGPALRTRRQAV